MRSIITAILVAVFCSSAFGQEITNPEITTPLPKPKTAAEYSVISHNQKTAGFVCLGLTAISIAIVAPGKVDWNTGGTIAGIGAASALLSIPLFIASGKNKRKAKLMMASQKTSYGLPEGEKRITGMSLVIPLGR